MAQHQVGARAMGQRMGQLLSPLLMAVWLRCQVWSGVVMPAPWYFRSVAATPWPRCLCLLQVPLCPVSWGMFGTQGTPWGASL